MVRTLFKLMFGSAPIPSTLLLALQLVGQELPHVGEGLLLLVQLLQARVRHGDNLGLEDRTWLGSSGPIVEPDETLALPHRVREVTLRTGALSMTNVQNLWSKNCFSKH